MDWSEVLEICEGEEDVLSSSSLRIEKEGSDVEEADLFVLVLKESVNVANEVSGTRERGVIPENT